MDLNQLTPERRQVWDKINQMMDVSYGCAESFIAAVGEYLWEDFDDSIQMISTGFSGGVGGSHEELCGGVSGAAIIFGLLYGRTTNDEALMIRCKRLISEHRDRFVQEFGTTSCQELRDAQYGADEDNPCSALIGPAAFMLLDILEEENERELQNKEKEAAIIGSDVLPFDDYILVHAGDKPLELNHELDRSEILHEYRNWIGEKLEVLGDKRPGVGCKDNGLPDIEWIDIPKGNVEIERAGEYEVDNYFLAKYPVTFKQFQVFIEHPAGFYNQKLWQDLSADNEHRSEPGEQRFQFDNHPRDNISWFDAVAYCRWINDLISKTEFDGERDRHIQTLIKVEGYEIRLPTEWEWQLAATGGKAEYKYPWGIEWDESQANTKHNQLEKTVAVGLYPAGKSMNGIFDLSGNIWEWCLNCYEDPLDLNLTRTDRRVLRGGSWYHWGSYAHTDMRSRYYPDHRYNAGGFRLACGKELV